MKDVIQHITAPTSRAARRAAAHRSFARLALALSFLCIAWGMPAAGEALAASDLRTFHGVVVETEIGLALDTEEGALILLKGRDMSDYVDVFVAITGEVGEDEDGNIYMNVQTVTEEDAEPLPPQSSLYHVVS